MQFIALAAMVAVVLTLSTQQTKKIVKTDTRIDDAREIPLDLKAHQNLLNQIGLARVPNLFETDAQSAEEKLDDLVRSKVALDDATLGASNVIAAPTLSETILDSTQKRIDINILG